METFNFALKGRKGGLRKKKSANAGIIGIMTANVFSSYM